MIHRAKSKSKIFSIGLFFLLINGYPVRAQYNWTIPTPIDTTHSGYYGGATAVDDSGNIYVTWVNNIGYDSIIIARSSDHGASWTSSAYGGVEIGRAPHDIVVDHKGVVWLVWISRLTEFSPTYTNLSKSTDHGQTFTIQFQSLSYSNGLQHRVKVDANNNIYMLWDDARFKVTTFRNGDISQRIDAEISTDSFQIGASTSLCVSRSGVVHCVWEGLFYDPATGFHEFVFCSSSVDSGVSFGSGVRVDTVDRIGTFYVHRNPSAVVDNNGALYVSYVRELAISSTEIELVRSIDSGKTFLAPLIVSDTTSTGGSILCIDSANGLNLVWTTSIGPWHSRSTNGGASFAVQSFVGAIGARDLQSSKYGELFLTGISSKGMSITSTNVILSVAPITENPIGIQLFQNYPNPFNPNTTIQFEVATRSMVDLRIYDVLGREIVTLLENRLISGSYSVQWNGSNSSSGIYFARMKIGAQFVKTLKMTLMR